MKWPSSEISMKRPFLAPLRDIRRKIRSIKNAVGKASCMSFVLMGSLFLFWSQIANATAIKDAVVDSSGDVHLLNNDGSDVKLTTDGLCRDAKVSPDRTALGWTMLMRNPESSDGFEPVGAAIYRKGVVSKIDPGLHFFGWSFWKDGSHVVVRGGPTHVFRSGPNDKDYPRPYAALYELSQNPEPKSLGFYHYDDGTTPADPNRPDWVSAVGEE
jgi:hypothetical protein